MAQRLCAVAIGVAAQFGLQTAFLKWTPSRIYVAAYDSMRPAIRPGDRIVADMSFFSHQAPARGDIVVLKSPRTGNLMFERVIGVGGDTLESKGARIILNGLPLAEPYAVRSSVDGQYSPWLVQFDRMTVPSGKFFVMGDDRDLSWDSRSSDFGPVGAESFRAKALYICWSSTYSRIGKRLE